MSNIGMTFRSLKKFLSQTISLAAPEVAIYTASMVESTILDCLILFYITTLPPSMNTKLEVDFLVSLSP